MDRKLLELLLVFAPLSLMSFGGGQGVVPEIQHQAVAVHAWLSDGQFADLFAISRAAPGPSSLLVALIGWQVCGLWGALIAAMAIFGPSSVLMYGFSRGWQRRADARLRRILERGLAPIAVGLLFAGVLTVLRSAHAGPLALVTTALVCAILSLTQTNSLTVVASIAAIYALLHSVYPGLPL